MPRHKQRWLRVFDLTRAIAETASALSRKYPGGRKRHSPHDSVYVATALAAGDTVVYTLDQHVIARFANNEEGVRVSLPQSLNGQLNFDY